ncbi:polysaccharide lyase family 7 protein [Caminibacter pacificus]|jgi:hypothetical protein
MRFFYFLLFLFILGCGGSGTDNKEPPLKLKKLQFLSQKAKLQAPTAKYNYKLDENFSNAYFYLSEGKYLTFDISENNIDDSKRSELRFYNEWNVSDNKVRYLYMKLKIVRFNKREFTFMQIHDSFSPLVRVVWFDDYKNEKNHLWAFIRDENGDATGYDLGELSDDFFDVNMSVKSGFLSIEVNGIKKIDNFDVSYWQNLSYFKAGVYLQDIGRAIIFVDLLKIED